MVTNKKRLLAIKKIDEIAEKLQESQHSRFTILNVLNDYRIILNDERITNNDILYSIITELDEYDNEEIFDYYELESYIAIMKAYRKEFNL